MRIWNTERQNSSRSVSIREGATPRSRMTPALPPDMAPYQSITAGLSDIYRRYVLPIERDFCFDEFYSPALTEGDFKAKPMILLLGQYSTGKTTFIRHLLEKDYPGLRIGPEPTTDKFVSVCHNDDCTDSGNAPAQVLPGHAAVVDCNLPWSQLESFGPNFLSRFEVVHVRSQVFKGVTLIDTPGVLAGNKQWERGYDFEGVIKWFAERVDLVLLFFDAHKLDISDEFRRCILALKGYESKVCILLNKADSVGAHHLMRVYGALMWSLGKVMSAPEVPRIYLGSFWDQPLQNNEVCKLFEQETDDLFKLIYSLPARSAARKIDDFLKRVRKCYTHCLLMDNIRRQLPTFSFSGRQAKQRELLDHLEEIIGALAKRYQIPLSDFPTPDTLRSKLNEKSLYKILRIEPKKLKETCDVVKARVAELTKKIPSEESQCLDMTSPFMLETSLTHVNPVSPTLWYKARARAITSTRPSTEPDACVSAIPLQPLANEVVERGLGPSQMTTATSRAWSANAAGDSFDDQPPERRGSTAEAQPPEKLTDDPDRKYAPFNDDVDERSAQRITSSWEANNRMSTDEFDFENLQRINRPPKN